MFCAGQVAFDIAGYNVTDLRNLDLCNGVLKWTGVPGTCTSVDLYPTQPELKPIVGQVTVMHIIDW